MTPTELEKYLDERGHRVLVYEHELGRLGLFVLKAEVGKLYPEGGAGIFSLYDLQFKKKHETFSAELSEFLKDKIELSAADIERLEAQAVLGS
jgi:hypothetical protein